MIRDDTDLQVLGYARESLEFFGTHCLVVKPKDGGIPVPFRLNSAQAYIHAKLEEQKAKTGKVRAMILKGRQQGCSTYIAARFYHRTSMHRGISAWIMASSAASHLRSATKVLIASSSSLGYWA